MNVWKNPRIWLTYLRKFKKVDNNIICGKKMIVVLKRYVCNQPIRISISEIT